MSKETLNMKQLQTRKRYIGGRNSITATFSNYLIFLYNHQNIKPKQKLLQQNKIHCPKPKTKWQCMEITPLLPNADKNSHAVSGIVRGTSTV
jgi:hypothetical protein